MGLDIKQPQPALLAHGQGDEAAQFDQLGFGEVLVQPRPQLIGGFQPPGNGFRVSSTSTLWPSPRWADDSQGAASGSPRTWPGPCPARMRTADARPAPRTDT